MNDMQEILKAINITLEATKARIEHIEEILEVVASRLEVEKKQPRSKKWLKKQNTF